MKTRKPLSKEGKRRHASAQAAYYEANKEAIQAHQKAYYEANKEAIQAHQKAYREANKERILAYQKVYYEANKEKVSARDRAHYKANRERILAYSKTYSEANAGKIKTYKRGWYEANREERLAHQKAYGKANKEACLARNARRRALKIQAILPTTDNELIKNLYKQRRIMTEEHGEQYHIDHIIPLSIGGAHHQDNLRIITAEENMEKGNKYIPELGGVWADNDRAREFKKKLNIE